MQDETDTQRGLERQALIAVKESDLVRMETELVLAFNHYQGMRKIEGRQAPSNRDPLVRRNVLDLRAAIEDLFLSIRLTENELRALDAPGWTD